VVAAYTKPLSRHYSLGGLLKITSNLSKVKTCPAMAGTWYLRNASQARMHFSASRPVNPDNSGYHITVKEQLEEAQRKDITVIMHHAEKTNGGKTPLILNLATGHRSLSYSRGFASGEISSVPLV
jgi:hypothetical protein